MSTELKVNGKTVYSEPERSFAVSKADGIVEAYRPLVDAMLADFRDAGGDCGTVHEVIRTAAMLAFDLVRR